MECNSSQPVKAPDQKKDQPERVIKVRESPMPARLRKQIDLGLKYGTSSVSMLVHPSPH